MSLKDNRLYYWTRRIVLMVIGWFFIFSIGSVILFKFAPIPFTLTMVDSKIKAVKEGKPSKIHYKWRSWKHISKNMPLAAVAAEDQNFPNHIGFDFIAMKKAMESNKAGKKVRGASTISQQVAKNVFLWQKRSYFRKIMESYFTVLIEIIWGKQRILEVYINIAEMGTNVFGVEAASQQFFNKNAHQINQTEAARLAAVLPSPKKWSAQRPGPYVSGRTETIKRHMRNLGGVKYIEELRRF